jgi:transposase
LVLDNATFHRSKITEELVKGAGMELLFLPPYSPHLTPIEQLWANLKRFWRNHAYLSLSDAIITSNYLQD